jgi:phosphonate transport system substrate-binding protein
MNIRSILVFTVAALLVGACATQPTPTATPEPPTPIAEAAAASGVITIAEIGDDPSDVIEDFQPFADYLAAHLAEQGIGVGEVKVAPDIETMTEWMESGEVDIYFDSTYPALLVSEGSGSVPILRRWKEGIEEYHSVIFSLADGDLDSIEDLPGHSIAFDEIYSTSGYMLPLAYMVEAGLTAVEVPDTDAEIPDDQVGYVFSGDDENAIQWVISGLVDAAVVDSGAYSEIPEETRDQLAIIAETEPLPRHLVIISPTIDDDVRDAIHDILVEMDENEEGQAVLETFDETAQFDEFPDGADAALGRMRELYEMVQNQ